VAQEAFARERFGGFSVFSREVLAMRIGRVTRIAIITHLRRVAFLLGLRFAPVAAHAVRTGLFITVSFRLGAILGGGKPAQVKNLYEAGKCAGLLFQIVDDILDKEGYATVIGLPEAKIQAQRLREKAKKHLKPLGRKAETLAKIIDFIADRDY
jgi:geranylgeranyl pyrophosphate synthase